MAYKPLLSSEALELVQRAEQIVLRAMRDNVIDLHEHQAIRRALSDAEGAARHADNCGRFAMAVLRDASKPQYINTLAAKAGYSEFEPLDAA